MDTDLLLPILRLQNKKMRDRRRQEAILEEIEDLLTEEADDADGGMVHCIGRCKGRRGGVPWIQICCCPS